MSAGGERGPLILIAEAAGFCFGVERSLRLADEALAASDAVSSLGPLIHNPQVIEGLSARGLSVITDPDDVRTDTLIIRCHGVGPRAFEVAAARGVAVIDGTCPFVTKAQRHAADLAADGYQVLVIGETDHPEVAGIVEHTGGKAVVVESASDLPDELSKRVGIVVQTTQPGQTLSAVVAAVAQRTTELRVFNTICSATVERQEAAVAVAEKVQLMIVVGGRNSGNTRRLAQLCRDTGTRTEHIETSAEIEDAWLEGVTAVGLTAGASTPRAALDDVLERIRAAGSTAGIASARGGAGGASGRDSADGRAGDSAGTGAGGVQTER